MKPTLLLFATAGLAATVPRGDAPCSNEACTSFCNATPKCQSTLFDPRRGQCYTFPCVVNNYSKPSEFLGYQKPGAGTECSPSQPIPGKPESPAPPEPPASPPAPPAESPSSPPPPPPAASEPPAPQPETEDPSPAPSGKPDESPSDVPAATVPSGGDATPTPGGPTETGTSNNPDSGEPSPTDDDDDAEPAAPTIVLPGSAPKALAPATLGAMIAALAVWLL